MIMILLVIFCRERRSQGERKHLLTVSDQYKASLEQCQRTVDQVNEKHRQLLNKHKLTAEKLDAKKEEVSVEGGGGDKHKLTWEKLDAKKEEVSRQAGRGKTGRKEVWKEGGGATKFEPCTC